MAEHIRDHLFAPFMTTKATGMGVGLAISRSIIEAHQGKIWVEPRPSGGGKFCFTLPLAEGDPCASRTSVQARTFLTIAAALLQSLVLSSTPSRADRPYVCLACLTSFSTVTTLCGSRLCLSSWHRQQGPRVPYKSLIDFPWRVKLISPASRRLHAACRLGSLRVSPKLIPDEGSPPGSDIAYSAFDTSSTVCLRSPLSIAPDEILFRLFPQRAPPSLLINSSLRWLEIST